MIHHSLLSSFEDSIMMSVSIDSCFVLKITFENLLRLYQSHPCLSVSILVYRIFHVSTLYHNLIYILLRLLCSIIEMEKRHILFFIHVVSNNCHHKQKFTYLYIRFDSIVFFFQVLFVSHAIITAIVHLTKV
jgi:hypothetical protein